MKKILKLGLIAFGITVFLVNCNSKVVPILDPPTATRVKDEHGNDTDWVRISASSMTLAENTQLRDEQAYRITVDYAYEVCDHEVTQAEWVALFGNTSNPSEFDGTTNKQPATSENQENRPVENVQWFDALIYCNRLSVKDGLQPCYSLKLKGAEINWATASYENLLTNYDKEDIYKVSCDFTKNGYRLLTNAEWEIAARCGKLELPFTMNNATEYAWYRDNSEGKTHEVKKKKPNAFGLYDMYGNVEEWCWDMENADRKYYGDALNPRGMLPPYGPTYRHCKKGYSYSTPVETLVNTGNEIYTNYMHWDEDFYMDIGFRIARTSK